MINIHNLDFYKQNINYFDPQKLILVSGKSDLINEKPIVNIQGHEIVYVSSVSGEGINNLKSRIVDIALKK